MFRGVCVQLGVNFIRDDRLGSPTSGLRLADATGPDQEPVTQPGESTCDTALWG